MEPIKSNKNILIFPLSLSISIAFSVIFYAYFTEPHDTLSGLLIWCGLPIAILYIMGFFVSRVEEERRNMVGWIMISYTLLYLLYLTCWVILAAVSPPVKESLADKIREIASILSLSAIWYGFNIPIFWGHKMKKHLYGVCLTILVIIGVLLCGEVIF